MVDPFSISTGCVGLLAAIDQLGVQISAFVSGVREARRDMEAVNRELSSLKFCLEALREDSSKIRYPDGLQQNLIAVIKNCDSVTEEMAKLLQKMSSASVGRRAQWVAFGKDDMNKLRSSLETHKSALDIALDLTTLLITSAVKEDTEAIRADTEAMKGQAAQIPSIKQDTTQITTLVQEIASLRLQVTILEQSDKGITLQRFLNDTTSYAESALGDYTYHEGNNNVGSNASTPRRSPSINGLDTQPAVSASTLSYGDQSHHNIVDLPAESPGSNFTESERSIQTRQTHSADTLEGKVERSSPAPRIQAGSSELQLSSISTPMKSIAITKSEDDIHLHTSTSTGPSTDMSANHMIERSANNNPAGMHHLESPESQSNVVEVALQSLRASQAKRIRRYPHLAAIEASRIVRNNLPESEKARLDKKFRDALTSFKSPLDELQDILRPKGRKPQVSVIRTLLNSGASMNSLSENALVYELKNAKRPEIVKLLLHRGALLVLSKEESLIFSSIVFARGQSHEVLLSLLEYGWDQEAGKKSALEAFIEYWSRLEYWPLNYPPETDPLLKLLKLLLIWDANVNRLHENGASILEFAAHRNALLVVKLLLEYGAIVPHASWIRQQLPLWRGGAANSNNYSKRDREYLSNCCDYIEEHEDDFNARLTASEQPATQQATAS